jgi:hypothetical protein
VAALTHVANTNFWQWLPLRVREVDVQQTVIIIVSSKFSCAQIAQIEAAVTNGFAAALVSVDCKAALLRIIQPNGEFMV